MDAGVPLLAPVAGIAMGLIEEGDRVAILSDILGDEDHLGDMDFKVAGTRAGITALQMDIKIRSVDWKVLERALEQARVGRLHILDRMEQETAGEFVDFRPRAELSRYAPRVKMITIKPDRIRDVIGPGGKVIRGIQDATGTKIDIDDSGIVTIFSPDTAALELAEGMVNELTQEAELDRVYLGKVKRITDFGAFVEIFPGTDGLIHISHLAEGRVEKVTDVVSEGDEVLAKCIEIDPVGPDPALAQGGAGGRRGGGVLTSGAMAPRRARHGPDHATAGRAGTCRCPRARRAGSAGFDLHAALERELVLEPGERALVPTGFAIAVPEGLRGAGAPAQRPRAAPRPRAAQRARHDRRRLPRRALGDRDERGPRADHAAARRSHRAARDRAGRERALRRGGEPRRRPRAAPAASATPAARRRRSGARERAARRSRAREPVRAAAAHAAPDGGPSRSAGSPTSRRACSPRRS